MIQIGVYGVGSRINARKKVSFCMAGDSRTPAMPVEEGADRAIVFQVGLDVVVPEAGRRAALDGSAPRIGETPRLLGPYQRVLRPHEEERGRLDERSARERVEGMAHQDAHR